MANYVKFIRGSLDAYTALQTKDNDTLYFITEGSGQNQKTLLYLGQNLISDSSSTLSQTAQEFLNNLPKDDSQLNEGDIQVYVIDYTEKEVTDPETGEVTTIMVPDGHWETKSIDELLAPFTGATINNDGLSGLVPAPRAGQNTHYLRGDGQWVDLNETVLQSTITQIVGEGQLDTRFDTLKEISDWILNDTTGAAALNSRLVALEEAVGTGKTEEVEQTVLSQLMSGEEGAEVPLYWNVDSETLTTSDNTGYPVYVVNENYTDDPENTEPQYIQAKDEITGDLLYWLEQPETTEIPNDYPAFVETIETITVPIPDALSELQAVVTQHTNSIEEIRSSLEDLNTQFNEKIETLDDLNEIIPILQESQENGALEALQNLGTLSSRVSSLEEALTWVDLDLNP